MIVDFQHHFTPRELIRQDPGDRLILNYDASGAPSYTVHSLLYDLDEHVRMMDLAGIDAAWLTSARRHVRGLWRRSRLVNDKAKKAERDYPGPLHRRRARPSARRGGGVQELTRCRHELGFQGVTITSEFDGKWIDDPGLEPFWNEVEKLGLFVFVHPALKLNHAPAIRCLRYRARGRARILADHGDDPAGQFRRVRPPSRTHRPHGASFRRHRRDARAHPLVSGQGFLGHRRQRTPRRQGQARFRLLHPPQSRIRHRRICRRHSAR